MRATGNATQWSGFAGDSANNFAFEMHQYLDSDDSGQNTTVVAGKGATVLNQSGGLATSWARTNGFKLFLGETGWSPNDSQSSGGVPSTEGSALMSYMKTNNDVWMGWSYWLGGSSSFYGGYIYSVVPAGYPTGPFTDTNQMSILTANIL
jgi:endoglucanase